MPDSLFNILGPVMVGPSSSHTAGAARIGLVSQDMVKQKISKVDFYLHGSFAETYKGHGTDRALVGGILGMKTFDENIIDALKIAKKKGLHINFIKSNLGNVHPNTVKVLITDVKGQKFSVTASSIGGGEIRIIAIEDEPITLSCNSNTLIVLYQNHNSPFLPVINETLVPYKKNIISINNQQSDKKSNSVLAVKFNSKIDNKLIKNLEKIKHVKLATCFNKI